MSDEPLFRPEHIVSRYTRVDAIRDDALVDVTEWASHDIGFRGGFHCAMAVTRAVWSDIENIPDASADEAEKGLTAAVPMAKMRGKTVWIEGSKLAVARFTAKAPAPDVEGK